jgi:hypothetical protein
LIFILIRELHDVPKSNLFKVGKNRRKREAGVVHKLGKTALDNTILSG